MNSSRSPLRALLNIPLPQVVGPASRYSRIIPAEELGRVAAWQPPLLGDGAAPPQHPLRLPRDRSAEAAPEPVVIDIEAAVAEARKAAYEEGYRDGMKALADFKKSHAEKMAARSAAQLAQWLDQLDAQWTALEPRMAESLSQTAVHLARQVLRQELHTHPEQVLGLAKEAVQAVSQGARRLELHVHPDDVHLVEAGLGDMLHARGGRIVADTSLSRGGCRLQADMAAVDASLERRWRDAAATLGSRLAWADDAPAADSREGGCEDTAAPGTAA